MGKTNGPKLPSFCLNRIRPLVRVRSPTIQSKLPEKIPAKTVPKVEELCGAIGKVVEESKESVDHVVVSDNNNNDHDSDTNNNNKVKCVNIGRKIMIVVDSSFEAKTALQWALSHTIQSQDKLVLLHVIKPSSSKQGKVEEISKERAPRAFELVYSLRNMCQSKRPEVEIEVCVVQGKEKGPTIVEEAKKQSVAMLVLGQKKRPTTTTWRLLMMWAGHRVTAGGVAEYCIQNAECMAIAVRRKNRRSGGYLISTKRQKDFWLLA